METENRLFEQVARAEWPGLVRWCTWLVGSRDVAEDLAQETLSAAWRSARRPTNPEEYPAWLAGIARNICRSWKRSRQRELAHHIRLTADGEQSDNAGVPEAAAVDDLEVILERNELAELLDRALALLPEETRRILIARYIEESPLAEVAVRLGLTESATAARLHRGKLALRLALTSKFSAEAASYGLMQPEAEGWQETRIWCPVCGLHHLLGRLDANSGFFGLQCPGCYQRTRTSFVGGSYPNLFQGLKSYRVALSRLSLRADAYYRQGLLATASACIRCGRPALMKRALPEELPEALRELVGITVRCGHCQAFFFASLKALTLAYVETRQFWRAHPRIQMLPERLITAEGRPALLTSFLSKTENARLDIISDYETLSLMKVVGGFSAH